MRTFFLMVANVSRQLLTYFGGMPNASFHKLNRNVPEINACRFPCAKLAATQSLYHATLLFFSVVGKISSEYTV